MSSACILLAATDHNLNREPNLACCIGALIIVAPILVGLSFTKITLTTTVLILWPWLARSSSSWMTPTEEVGPTFDETQDDNMDECAVDEIDGCIVVEDEPPGGLNILCK